MKYGVTVLLEELQGNYSGELADTFNALINEVMVSYKIVNEGLENAVETYDSLSDNLGNFKTNDDSLEESNNTLKSEENKSVTRFKNDENNNSVETDEWKKWNNRVNELRRTLEEIKNTVLMYKENSDIDIKSINDFNDSIVNIRLKLATVAFAQDGMTLDEIKALTPTEREALIQKMIDAMTVKYEQYKSTYEEMANDIYYNALKDPGVQALKNVFIVVCPAKEGKAIFISKTEVGQALELVQFLVACEELKTSDGRSLIQCVREYGETGDFNGSGLGELYWAGGHFGTLDSISVEQGYYNGEMEQWFEIALVDGLGTIENYKNSKNYSNNYYPPDDARKICRDIGWIYDDLSSMAFDFKENYNNAVTVGVAIKGMQELKGHVKYDTIYMDPNFIEYNNKAGSLVNFLDDMCNKDLSEDEKALMDKATYMTKSELEMFRYLYNNNKESWSAEQFAKSIDISLTKREGVVNAYEYYDYLMSGNNAGLEAAWDHISSGGTGFGDGIVDLVAPSKTLTVNEYAQIAFVDMLKEDSSGYSKSLLASYDIGNSLGNEAIPIVASLVNPTLGKAARIASSTGNALEDYFRADDSTTYWEAAVHAGIDLSTTEGVDTMASVLGLDKTPMGKLGVAAIKSMMSSGVDYMYDPESGIGGDLIGAMTKCMKGQLSGEFTDMGKDKFSDYLQGIGWPKNWAETTAGLFEPAIKSASSAMLDSAEAMVNTAGNNYLNGTSDSVIMAGIDQFGESFDLGGSIKDVSKNIGSAASDEYLDTVAERTYGGSGLFD